MDAVLVGPIHRSRWRLRFRMKTLSFVKSGTNPALLAIPVKNERALFSWCVRVLITPSTVGRIQATLTPAAPFVARILLFSPHGLLAFARNARQTRTPPRSRRRFSAD